MNEVLIEKLILFGLTKGEAKAYLALNIIGEAKVGEIIRESKISSSKIYDVLKRLSDKGLITYTIRNNKKYFSKLSIKSLEEFFEKQEEELNKKKDILYDILPKLENYSTLDKEEGNVIVYEGLSALKNYTDSTLSSVKKGENIYLIGAGNPDVEKTMRGFLDNWQDRRIDIGIKFQGLYNSEFIDLAKDRANKDLTEVRILDNGFFSPVQLLITDNSVATYIFEPKIKVILIYGKNIATSYKNYFESLWKMSKKI